MGPSGPFRTTSLMRFARIKGALALRNATVYDAVLLLAALAVGWFIALEYDVFSSVHGGTAEQTMELDEALALGALLCVGLLVLSWRFMLGQRREMQLRIESEHQARELAMRDALTGLPNRRRFNQELKAAIEAPPSRSGSHAAFSLDLNDFKQINDVYGHAIGDQVLVMVAQRLERSVRDGDLVARFGGDEFAILARQLASPEEATTIALRVIEVLDQPMTIGTLQHTIGVGIGIALIPHDGKDVSEILRKADIALYRAKAERRSASRFFEPEMDARVRERELLERELRKAVQAGTIVPFYQPLMDLRDNRVIGFEALARWTHPTLGEIETERFIAIAESCGLISPLSDQLLRKACSAASQWPGDLTLSFNISPLQLKDPTLGLRILSILGETGLSPRRLEIELTEAALVRDMEDAQAVLGTLRHAGIRIALDDFGTGYSNLYHLRNFEIDKIKIDRSFVLSMQHEAEARALVRALMGLGHGLGLTITAEGVEDASQAQALAEQGCEQAQGFLYSRAIPAKEVASFIARHGARAEAPTQAGDQPSAMLPAARR